MTIMAPPAPSGHPDDRSIRLDLTVAEAQTLYIALDRHAATYFTGPVRDRIDRIQDRLSCELFARGSGHPSEAIA
ncbi:MAG: hypothetical protein M0P31_13835 [Solirubrobacteraceae bacterium]|nr:hypothetical protein [Solirubrobacteraceae bacterium]